MYPSQQLAELFRIGQGGGRSLTVELLAPMEALQTGAELAAKYAAENFHRQEEGIVRPHPTGVIRGQPAGRDDAMDMRM